MLDIVYDGLDNVKSMMMAMTARRKVLDAAIDLIVSDGPDAISMREVARRANVSHQAPYHHFTDRAGIFAAIAAEGFDILAARMREVIADDPNPARRCFEAYVMVALEFPAHFRVMFRADLCQLADHEDARASADAAFGELLNMVDRTIGRPAGGVESFVWASALWSAAHGLSMLLLDGPLLSKMPSGLESVDLVRGVIDLFGSMVDQKARDLGYLAS